MVLLSRMTVVSRNDTLSTDHSAVNLIVWWNWSLSFKKSCSVSIPSFQMTNISSINLHRTIGLAVVDASICSSRSVMKMLAYESAILHALLLSLVLQQAFVFVRGWRHWWDAALTPTVLPE